MVTYFRDFEKNETAKEKMMNYVSKKFGCFEITKVAVKENVYGALMLQVKYNTQTEKQKICGNFDSHDSRILLEKLPKKYSPLI